MSFPLRIREHLRRVVSLARASTTGVLVALVAARGCSPVIGAEVVIGPDGAPAVAIGPVDLYPSFLALVEYNDNLLNVETGQTATWMRLISPGVAIELPFSHSLLRAGYNLSVRNYGFARSQWLDTHTGLFDLNLGFGNGAAVVVHDDFKMGILDTQVGDPGGELPFRGQRYRTNGADLYAGHERAGMHKFGFRIRSLSTTYLDPLVAPYFNEAASSLAAEGTSYVGPQTWIVWEALGGTAELDRPESSVAPAEKRTQHESSLRVGAGWALSKNASFQFIVGPERQAYDADAPSTFRGLVGDMTAQSTAETGPHWLVDLSRYALASISENNNYFVSEQITVRAESSRGAPVRFGGSTAYYRNDYPTDPGQRLDRTWAIETWVGIRQGVWVEWRVSVRYDVRSSTLPGVDYSSLRYGVGLVVGR